MPNTKQRQRSTVSVKSIDRPPTFPASYFHQYITDNDFVLSKPPPDVLSRWEEIRLKAVVGPALFQLRTAVNAQHSSPNAAQTPAFNSAQANNKHSNNNLDSDK